MLLPVVLSISAWLPTATLPLPVVLLWRQSAPIPTRFIPVVFELIAALPTAVLLLPDVLPARQDWPTPTLLFAVLAFKVW